MQRTIKTTNYEYIITKLDDIKEEGNRYYLEITKTQAGESIVFYTDYDSKEERDKEFNYVNERLQESLTSIEDFLLQSQKSRTDLL